MNQLANEIVGTQLARTVAQRAEALEVLRKGVKPMGMARCMASAISAGISGAVAGHAVGVAHGELLGFAVACSLSLGMSAFVACYQMRKRLEATITLLLQDVKNVP